MSNGASQEKTFVVRMTERELWFATQNIAASFTNPDAMNEYDRSGLDKLEDAHFKAQTQGKQS